MKEFNGYISDDGLKIGTKQDVLDYEESLKIPELVEELCSSVFYNAYAEEFQFDKVGLEDFLINEYVIELFYLFNGKEIESIVVNETQGTISMKRNVVKKAF